MLDQIDFKVARKIFFGHCQAGEADRGEQNLEEGEALKFGIYKSKVNVHQN